MVMSRSRSYPGSRRRAPPIGSAVVGLRPIRCKSWLVARQPRFRLPGRPASSDADPRDFPAIHQSAPGNRHAPCNDGCEPNVWALLIGGASEPFGELSIRPGQRQRSNGNC
jgi:hypothetical protein